jgi:hypothetical protein
LSHAIATAKANMCHNASGYCAMMVGQTRMQAFGADQFSSVLFYIPLRPGTAIAGSGILVVARCDVGKGVVVMELIPWLA